MPRYPAAALTLAAALALAGCGSSSTSHHTRAKPAAQSTVQAAPSPLPAPAVHVSKAGERIICANINVMIVTGSGDPYTANVGVVSGQYHTSQYGAEMIIAKAIGDECPSDTSVIPAGAPTP